MPAATAVATEFAAGEVLSWLGVRFFSGSTATGNAIKSSEQVVKESGAAAQTTTKASTILQNAKKGAEFEKQVVEEASNSQTDVAEQITLKTKSGTKTKIDVVGKDKATVK